MGWIVPARNKATGVCYAFTVDGVELPVIDVTHPAFQVARPAETELSAMMAHAAADQEQFDRMPAAMRKTMLWLLSRRSVLMRGVMAASGTYLSGMSTYLLKLGPDNLGTRMSGKLDRVIAASLPALSARLRLQDLVRILADAVAPVLAARPGRPLQCINIAGGPSMDSLNLLVLLNKERPGLLAGRPIRIRVLDLNSAGPVFAGRALAALQAPGAPLQGLNATLEHIRYDWSDPSRLRDHLAGLSLDKTVVAVSSEGGLFDYGSGEEILANLQVLYDLTPQDAVLAGTLTSAAGPGQIFNRTSGARTISRTRGEFSDLAGRSGWAVKEYGEAWLNDVFGLRKT